MAVKFNKNFNIGRVVRKLVYTILALYVGGTIVTTFGSVINNTASPFYEGLSLIGWTVTDAMNGTTSACGTSAQGFTTAATINNCVTAVSGTGVLAVVGIIGIAAVVMEFVTWK